MGVPKKKMTKRRIGNRRSCGHGKFELKESAVCSNCATKVMPHKICSNCGYYKGKKILNKLV